MSVKVNKTSKKLTKKTAKGDAPTKGEVVRSPSELHPLQTLRHEIDSLFDSMLSGFPSVRFPRPTFDVDLWREPFRDPFRRFEDTFGALSKLSPRADLKETDKSVVITAEMPGVTESDIDVSVSDGRLTIRAEKKEETRKDEDNYHLSERHYGSVLRTFALPETADQDKATATFKDGVLTIDVPKKPSAKAAAKKIPVKG